MTQVKSLGRQVENFDEAKWVQQCENIVYEANLAKFKQNPGMKKILLQTGDCVLAVCYKLVLLTFERKQHEMIKFGVLAWDQKIQEYKIQIYGWVHGC